MIDTLFDTFNSQVPKLDLSFNLLNISEILIISIVVFAFYKKFIKNTQAEKLVKGLLFLAFGWILASFNKNRFNNSWCFLKITYYFNFLKFNCYFPTRVA